jgi:hypothetical protein
MAVARQFINGIPVINNLDSANQYATAINKYALLNWSFYDSTAYAIAGQNALAFFQSPVGAGVSPITGNAKTLDDTNMQAAGAMPNLQAFIVNFVEVEFQEGWGAVGSLFPAATLPAVFGAQAIATQVNDTWKFYATGFLNFTIGQTPFLIEGPLYKFAPSNNMELDAAAADISTTGANMQTRLTKMKAVGPAYSLSPNNLLLIPLQPFNVTLNWGTLVPIISIGRVFVRLNGNLIRAAQ